MRSVLDESVEHAKQWLRENSALIDATTQQATDSQTIKAYGKRLDPVALIDMPREAVLEALRSRRVDDDDQRTLAILGIAFGREGDLQTMLEVAAYVDLRSDSNIVIAFVRLLLDQQRLDGSVGYLGPELRMLHGDETIDLAIRSLLTQRYVDCVTRSGE